MATVDAGYAAWLKATSRSVGATIAGAEAAWGTTATDSRVTSALATQADAQAVCNDQAANLLAGPLARDRIRVPGYRRDLIGCAINIIGNRLGYEGGRLVLVLGAAEQAGQGMTVLTVLKRL